MFIWFSTELLKCICCCLFNRSCGHVNVSLQMTLMWFCDRHLSFHNMTWNSCLNTHAHTHTVPWHTQRQSCVANTKSDRGWKEDRMKDGVDHLKGNLFWLHWPLPFMHTFTHTFLLSLFFSYSLMILFLHVEKQKRIQMKHRPPSSTLQITLLTKWQPFQWHVVWTW